MTAKLLDDGNMFTGAGCPACKAQRLHTDEELSRHHPLARQGCVDGNWSHPEAEAAHERDRAALVAAQTAERAK
jgi:hypothetical protein